MLEVCFGDSAKGALALAQKCGSSSIGGAVGVITDKKWPLSFFEKRRVSKEYRKKQAERDKRAVPLGGQTEDVASISFLLSEGNIRAPIVMESCTRKDFLLSVFSYNRHNAPEDIEPSFNHFWSNCIEDLKKIKSSPEKIRIWLDHTPDAQCGLLFIADLLKDCATEIHVVELPEYRNREDACTIAYRGWGEVEPRLFSTFLNRERTLSKDEVQDLCHQWQKLKEENAPLRAVENGVVISADESYYDPLIRKEFPKEPCKIAFIIGSALSKQNMLTGDVFVAKRMEHFIQNGELIVLGNTGDGFYSTIVRCTK